MKKILLTLVVLVFSYSSYSQHKLVKPIKNFFKYSTLYTSGEISNSIEAEPFYTLRTVNGNLYGIPEVVNSTIVNPFDYRLGFGIRKLARFDYEMKPGQYYKGTENQFALSTPTSASPGFEYLFNFEKERQNGKVFDNHRYFLRHTSKYSIVKVEDRKVDKLNLNYKSAEARLRIPIDSKISINLGAIYRTHKRAYGYNPFELWVNELNSSGNPIHYWWSLGHLYGYADQYTGIDADGNGTVDNYTWVWRDNTGKQVANSDADFRDDVMPLLINRYNKERWDTLSPFGVISPVVGFDFYHYEDKFWMHTYGNILLPLHKYVAGHKDYNYTNRNNFGVGGLIKGSKPQQWVDYSCGINVGYRIGKHIGIFAEGEFTKYWDTRLFQSSFGINYQIK